MGSPIDSIGKIVALLALTSCGGSRIGLPPNAYWEALPSRDTASVSTLAVGAGLILAGTGAGLFASLDSESWQLRSSADWAVSAVLATSTGTILIGTYRHGIWRSTDGGRTWASAGFERNVYIDALVQDSSGRIFAAIARSVSDEPTGVFRSDDGGKSWNLAGLEGEHVYSIAMPFPGELYAGTESGTFRSSDDGETWSRIEQLSFSAPLSGMASMDEVVVAGFGDRRSRAPGSGIFFTRDRGVTWMPGNGLPPQTSVHAFAVVGHTIFAATGDHGGRGGMGIFRSADGQNWESAGLGDEWVHSLALTPGDTLLAGTAGSGVFVSSRGLEGWAPRNTGLRNWFPAALEVDGAGQVYALLLGTLYRFDEQRRTWVQQVLPDGAAPPTPWNFVRRSDGALVLPGINRVFFYDGLRDSWSQRELPHLGGVFSAYTGDRDRLFVIAESGRVFESRDSGETWMGLDVPEGTRGVLVSRPGTLLAFGNGIHRSVGGDRWERVAPEAVATAERCGNSLYAGTFSRGVLTSRDDGHNWEPITDELRLRSNQPGLIAFHSIICLPDGAMLAATFSDGVFFQAPGGSSWEDASAGLPTRTVGDLALAPDGRVFIATAAGVYGSSAWQSLER